MTVGASFSERHLQSFYLKTDSVQTYGMAETGAA